MSKLNILYVEDSIEQQTLFKLYIKSKPHEFRFAGSFEEAEKLMNQESFDLIFLDWSLPGKMGAPEFIEKIRSSERKGKNTPCYVVTGYTKKDITGENGDLPIDGILSKPVRKKDLLELLDGYTA